MDISVEDAWARCEHVNENANKIQRGGGM